MTPFNHLLKKIKLFEDDGFAWLVYLFVIGLFFSRAVLSFSGVLLFTYAIVQYLRSPFKVSLQSHHLLFFVIYGAHIVSIFINPQQGNEWGHLLFRNAPLLLLPLAFLLNKSLKPKAIRRIFLLFLISTALCVCVNSIVALAHYHQFLNDVTRSKNIQSLIGPNHSNLGVLNGVAFVMGFYLLAVEPNKRFRFLLTLLLAFLFIGIHLLAYRFSVVSIYLIVISFGVWCLFKTKNIKIFLASSLILWVCLWAVILVPAVNERYKNTIEDFNVIIAHENPNYQSLAQRFYAMKCAVEVIKQHPLWGVGPANAKVKMQEQYAVNSYLLIPENRILVHNQFIYYALCFGIPLGLFVAMLLVIAILIKTHTHPLLTWMMIPFLLHMVLENTLEMQITANAFILLLLLDYRGAISKKSINFLSENKALHS